MPNLERLQTLADWLASGNVPSDRFDMAMWGNGETKRFCGCAVGWGLQCPALIAQGFMADPRWAETRLHSTLPVYKFAAGWDAVEFFFYLNRSQALYLFNDPRGNRTIAQEIKILRDFIEDHRGFEHAAAHAAWLAFYAKLPLALPAPIPVRAEPATESAHTTPELSTN